MKSILKIVKNFTKTQEIKIESINQAKKYDKQVRFEEYIKLYKE